MDLRDYLRIVRRGWPLLLAVVLLSLSAASLYLLLAPKQYIASATLLVTVNDPSNVGDAGQGLASATSAAATYAGIIDSAVVVGPVAQSLRPALSLPDALGMLTATARTSTALIDVTVIGGNPALAAQLANGVSRSAVEVIPALQGRSTSNAPIALRTIQNAALPAQPLSPDPQQVLSLGLIVGLVLGLAITIASYTLNTRLRRPEDVQKAGLVVLASLPRVPRAQRQGVVVADHPNSPAVEAYRTLRTNLGNLESEARRSVLLAPVADDRDPAEVPINVAWSLAQSGRTVLLVDLDLRRAPISDVLRLPVGPGLTDLIMSSRPAGQLVIRATRHPRVHAITAGSPHASPSDVLALPRLGELIRAWEQQYDYVILNAPSLLRHTEAAVVARETGVTIVTVRAGKTKAAELETATGVLGSVRVVPMGAILTDTRTGTARDNRKIRSSGGSARGRVTEARQRDFRQIEPDELGSLAASELGGQHASGGTAVPQSR